ncbi:hypothetical protein LOK49_LG02G00099 [Camellia lanceoleosa]|uniref:Uncharacterized protein n=1 Tax=Camellia lanceoleosa TaxID=1840588 RepID=A0ACC0IHR6_9ERIC|nr:hypothetical protein LOK49_LG02G00099 [Camellia lanceoleosa]
MYTKILLLKTLHTQRPMKRFLGFSLLCFGH